ncbi:MAG: 23S rRNA (adenine(2503)-C(2))-methyltransferase RlmN [Actinobacteria bacterium]|jgi:23S rRNA (adenine2503-C2)-methyltransferase|nr:23S rRNA (adenine(2503)-C(2))-methyltransferase RlmN [Actinomycetota bacterium]HPE12303.1 23S rRNA (adenine(2503)-C(2))-methyltransferase RlmN [Actinomycetota bacterium]HRV67448.1 23S rRNA (adenine(2503)-C(2))-methyltransferase RlmN [Candidatus Nanopelagicales bacterium]
MTSLPLVMQAPRRGKPPQHLLDLDLPARRQAVTELGSAAFRAAQLSRQVVVRHVDSVDECTDLGDADRERLAPLLPTLLTASKVQTCDGDATRKTLWKLHDGALVESVLMRYPKRVTLCLSSQAGCGMACPFCATGQGGLQRNLSVAEILEQVRVAARDAQSGVLGDTARLSNVVFMGMGEPLANYSTVVTAVRRMIAQPLEGFGLSARGVTVSTVGLVPQIRRLADEQMPVTLAVSLHAPDDELRNTLVPINTRWSVGEVLDSAWEYADKTRRRVSIEYALIRDINDQDWRADLLGDLLQGRLVHVNVIPLNPTPGTQWTASSPEQEESFVEHLRAKGVAVTVRDTRGREIDGACGQLAASET